MFCIKPSHVFCALFSLSVVVASEAGAQVTITESKTSSGATITNYESSGNLAATNPLSCVSLKEVKNEHSPADIFSAVSDCLNKERYQEATELFKIAGAYGNFDKLRVADRSAHQAITVLIMNHLDGVAPDKKEKWQAYLSEQAKPDSKMAASTCEAIRRLGPPRYYPSYMIQHGMGAFTGTSKEAALVTPFDANAAWDSTFDDYLHCAKH